MQMMQPLYHQIMQKLLLDIYEQDYYVCNDTNKICHGPFMKQSTSGEKVYTINIEDFTILLQHSISKVSVNIYIYISIRQMINVFD